MPGSGATSAGKPLMREALRVASWIISFQAVAAILSVVNLGMAARLLGPAGLGRLTLITTFVSVVGSLVSFQSWEALVKYGAAPSQSQSPARMGLLFRLGLQLDVLMAVAGTVVAALMPILFGGLIGLEPSDGIRTALYATALLGRLPNVPTAALRLGNQFERTTLAAIVTQGTRLALAASLSRTPSLDVFLAIWWISETVGQLVLLALGLRSARSMGISLGPVTAVEPAIAGAEGLWSFLWASNLQSSLRLFTKDADTLLVGGLLGVSDAAHFRIVKQSATALGLVSSPFYQWVYPVLVRLWSAGEWRAFRTTVGRFGAIVGGLTACAWIAVVVGGPGALEWLLGPAYRPAHTPMTIYLLGTVIAATTFAFHPALLAMGNPRASLGVLTVSTGAYLILLVVTTPRWGLPAAAASFVGFYVVWTALMVRALARSWESRRRPSNPRPA